MKRRKTNALEWLLLCTILLVGQVFKVGAQSFDHNLGFGAAIVPTHTHITADTSIMVFWKMNAFSMHDSSGVVLLDKHGQYLWQTEWINDLHVLNVRELPNGYELIASDRVDAQQNDGVVRVVLDLNGTPLSYDWYDYDWGQEARFAEPAPDGGWLIGGTVNVNYQAAAGTQPMQLIRIDASGALLWQYTYLFASTGQPCLVANDAQFNSDGSFYLGGFAYDSNSSAYLAHFDAYGQAVWSHELYGLNNVMHLDTTESGKLIAFANASNLGAAFEFDTSGNMVNISSFDVWMGGVAGISGQTRLADGSFRLNYGNVFCELDSNLAMTGQKTLNMYNAQFASRLVAYRHNHIAGAFSSNSLDSLNVLGLDTNWNGQCSNGILAASPANNGYWFASLPITATQPPQGAYAPAVVQNTMPQVAVVPNCGTCAVVLNENITDVLCTADSSGVIALSPTGGTAPYDYSWSHDANLTDSVAEQLGGGMYFITVTDAQSCTHYAQLEVSTAPPFSLGLAGTTHPTCVDFPDGVINLSPQGGIAPYAYAWADDSTWTDSIQTGLAPGAYCVTVTDSLGCTSIACIGMVAPGPPTISTTVNHPPCSGTPTGSLAIAASLGSSYPYTYEWSHDTAYASHFAWNLGAGEYCVTVTAASGCSVTICDTLVAATTLDATTTAYGAVCGTASGLVSVGISGSSGPYTFNWTHDASLNTNLATGLAPGTYCVQISDASGCQAQVCDSVVDAGPLPGDLIPTQPTSCSANDGGLSAVSWWGQQPYTYAWSHSTTETASYVSGVGAGSYCVTVTDQNGCSNVHCTALANPDSIQLATSIANPTCVGALNGLVAFSVAGGVPPYAYIFGTDTIAQDTVYNLAEGNYLVGALDANGCSTTDSIVLTATELCDSVCPGDANKDGIVNNLDLLYVGLAQGQTGPARSPASTVWQHWPAADWNTAFASGVNHKHADCDGNGAVQPADTLAVGLNYGSAHQDLVPSTPPTSGPGSPQLYLLPNADTLQAGDTLVIEVFLGTDTLPVDSLHGIAFTIHYDSVEVDSEDVHMAFVSSFLGAPGVDAVTIKSHNHSQRFIEAAITRLDLLGMSGSGKIAELHFDGIQDDLSGKGNGWLHAAKSVSPSQIFATSPSGTMQAIEPVAAEVVLMAPGQNTSIAHSAAGALELFPNPATDVLNVYWNGQQLQNVQLFDALGKLVATAQPTRNGRSKISCRDLQQGLYVVRVESQSGIETRRVIISR